MSGGASAPERPTITGASSVVSSSFSFSSRLRRSSCSSSCCRVGKAAAAGFAGSFLHGTCARDVPLSGGGHESPSPSQSRSWAAARADKDEDEDEDMVEREEGTTISQGTQVWLVQSPWTGLLLPPVSMPLHSRYCRRLRRGPSPYRP